MKILKIFGLVVGVHVAVFLLIFAIPGCRSTGKGRNAPAATSVDATPGAAAVSYGGAGAEPISAAPVDSYALSGDDLNPAVAPAPSFTPVDSAAPAVRFSPTRPGTPAAQAVQTRPLGDVTPVSAYTVVKGDSFWSIAKKHGVTVAELTRANSLGANASLRPGQKLIIPAKVAPVEASAPAAAAGGESHTYIVRSGDTLGSVARAHGVTVAELRSLNKLRGDTLRVDQTLLLPTGATATPAPEPASAKPSAAARNGNSVTHTVAAGETLGGIARRYGVSVGAVAEANHIQDPRKIRAGQQLAIPGGSAAKAAASAPPPAPATTPEPAASQPASSTPAPASSPFLQPVPVEEPAADPNREPDEVPVIRVEEPVITPAPQPPPDGETPPSY
ncbi:MAG TPA: LysM peptidoglycan-binding domain-containing protein [Opitutaceae bacterium]